MISRNQNQGAVAKHQFLQQPLGFFTFVSFGNQAASEDAGRDIFDLHRQGLLGPDGLDGKLGKIG